MSGFLVDLSVGLALAFVALVFHEAGHLVAGKVVGFRIAAIGVGPIGLFRQGSRFGVRTLPVAMWGPFAAAYPVRFDRMRQRAAWYIAGGPLASLLLAFAAVPAISGGSRALAFIGLISACVFVATAQPFGTGAGVPSDGARVVQLAANREGGEAAAALVALQGEALTGRRPSEWDAALVATALRIESPPSFVLAAATFALRRALDAGDRNLAAHALQRITAVFDRVPRWLRADAATEAAFHLARAGGDLNQARRFLQDASGPLVEPYRRWRAEAAVLLCAGDRNRAREALARARRALDEGIGMPSAFDREAIASIEASFESRA